MIYKAKKNVVLMCMIQVIFVVGIMFAISSLKVDASADTSVNTSVDVDTNQSSAENQQEIKDGDQQNFVENQNEVSGNLPPSNSNVSTGGTAGHTWKFYGSSKGSSKAENTMSNEIVSAAVTILTSGGNEVAEASASLVKSALKDEIFNHISSLFNPPTYYWWSSTWKDKDSSAIYTRHHVKNYSDAARNDKIADFWSYQTY
ncbi:hypothetical protein [Lentilactobacillus hilgardii]|uniref:hypothetical protein n=1 Tax=Lentilactobacillus hilgardii TaxID=1588 RepID=UPI0021A650CE|nr:hypothetical protein [Lentilactobacillus hilgardii]MCT3399443.1 hypothetical protein [Lentilactobacillus hilgardii]